MDSVILNSSDKSIVSSIYQSTYQSIQFKVDFDKFSEKKQSNSVKREIAFEKYHCYTECK
jgi:hypothetical protein